MDEETEQMKALAELTDVAFQRASAPLVEFARREAELRAALAALTPSSAWLGAEDVPEDAKTMARQTGADFMWDRWAARKKSELNMALARVLAEKASVEARARRAFGRDQVVRQIVEDLAKKS
ncbi:hypothetical protein SAMN05421688_2592 [Poseidonocella pacifica]|uniref:Uncharacterized protein n=1 Tax=Poseidonocella pacifica TaxID=871651 RepID=A0A1I0XY89_9RHOB|nr:hypothetical protein [Poseidonocella pacifica]SFB05376.1 hypothetical protein SAMN05421688_2592 [Poseidonocella pacifica]